MLLVWFMAMLSLLSSVVHSGVEVSLRLQPSALQSVGMHMVLVLCLLLFSSSNDNFSA